MKKYIFMGLLVTALCLALTCAHASVRNDGPADLVDWAALRSVHADTGSLTEDDPLANAEAAPMFKLPAFLQFIEDEAFEGTAIISVELPDTVESVGESAFANIPTLLSVKIPANTEKIARTAFAGSTHVVITGAPGSYARTYARENSLPFEPITAIYAGTGSILVPVAESAQRTGTDTVITGTAEGDDISPQWRPAEEIKTEQFEQCIAHSVVGRAPPAWA